MKLGEKVLTCAKCKKKNLYAKVKDVFWAVFDDGNTYHLFKCLNEGEEPEIV